MTTELLEETYEKLRVSADQPVEGGAGGDDLESTHYLKIVDAFAMPPWRWGDELGGFEKLVLSYRRICIPWRKRKLINFFYRRKIRASKGPSLAPPPTSKARYLRDRYNIVKQVILRNEHFSPPAIIGGSERQDYMRVGFHFPFEYF